MTVALPDTVLVTGAAAGLGKALAMRFAAGGYRVGLIDADADALGRTAGELRGRGATVVPAAADVSDPEAVATAVGTIRAALGPIGVLINNAGVTAIGNFTPDGAKSARRVVDVNLVGSINATAACLDDIAHAGGSIIVISSVAGFAPLIGRTAYAASKHALHGFFNTLRLEQRGAGVSVMLVCPSFIATGIRRHLAPAGADAHGLGRTTGTELTPEAAAECVWRGWKKGRRQITIGRVAWLSAVLWRFAPGVYERLMLGRIRDEPRSSSDNEQRQPQDRGK